MNNLFSTLFQMVLVSGVFYGYYVLFLRNKQFHPYNRCYLLLATACSLAIPFIHIPIITYPISGTAALDEQMSNFRILEVSEKFEGDLAIGNTNYWNWSSVLLPLYLIIAFLFFTRLIYSLVQMAAVIRKSKVVVLNGMKVVFTRTSGAPYSFFNWMFWDQSIDMNSFKGQQVFRHEQYHIQRRHSWDLLFLEIVRNVGWINPFFHLMQKELRTVHEFLADRHTLVNEDCGTYAEFLLMRAMNTNQSLVNPFFHTQIKRRVNMITNSTKTSHRHLRRLMVLPVLIAVIGLFAFTYRPYNNNRGSSEKRIKIVVDAGHGSIDKGVSTPTVSEADISLQISKKIAALSDEYNVEVILTRTDDNFPRKASTIQEALKERVSIAQESNADAFISIHVDGSGSSKTQGIRGYIRKHHKDQDAKLAGHVLQELGSVYVTSQTLITRNDKGIFVLDKNPLPSVLIGCGMITNEKDLAFITSEEGQEKIARQILKGVVAFDSSNDTTYHQTK